MVKKLPTRPLCIHYYHVMTTAYNIITILWCLLQKRLLSFDHIDFLEFEQFLLVVSSLLHSGVFAYLVHGNIDSFPSGIVPLSF